MRIPNTIRGFTAIEAVVSLGIVGMIVIGLALLFGRGIGAYRFQFEQVLTTDEARGQLDKMSKDFRHAVTLTTGYDWLVGASNNAVSFYTNVDDDAQLELVRYWIEGTTLRKGVTQAGEAEDIQVLAEHVKNENTVQPLFTYLDKSFQPILVSEVTSDNVSLISATLIIDVRDQQLPGPLTLSTIVARRGKISSLNDEARLWPTTLNYPLDPTTTNQVEVTIEDPSTGNSGTSLWDISIVNNGQLATYDGHYVNINYQATTVGNYLPGWYAWIGPITVGQSGTQVYKVTDQVPIAELCLGDNFSLLLTTCASRTVTYETFSAQYKPIIIRTALGEQDFIKDITFTYTPPAAPTPTPEPTPSPTPPPAPVPELAFWRLEETNSSNAADTSGNGLNGELKQGLASSWDEEDVPTLVPPSVASLAFDGQKHHILLPNSSQLNFTTDFTFSTWVKFTGTGTYTLLSGGGSNSGYGVRLVNGAVSAGWNNLFFTSAITANSGQWRHIAVVFTASNIGVSIYINGTYVAGGGGGALGITPYTGERRIGSTAGGGDYYEGKLDDIRLYNRALTAAEILYLAQGNDL